MTAYFDYAQDKQKKGFTLIELMVAISIVAILSAIGLTLFTSVQKSARDAKRRGDLKAISAALEQYKLTNKTYPATEGWVLSDSANEPWLTGLGSYMVSVSRDPKNSGGNPWGDGLKYGYFTSSGYGGPNGGYFMLVAHLESPNSEDKKTKCTFPDGSTFGSTNSGAGNIYPDNFFVCNQQ